MSGAAGGDSAVPQGVIAVIRAASADEAVFVGRAVAPVVAAIEITFTVPDAAQAIARLVDEGLAAVGAGTVRTPDEIDAAVDAGAAFAVSPHTDAAVLARAVDRGIPMVPGAATPTEMVQAMAAGASAVKLFPVEPLGGLAYLRAVLEPLGDLPIVVSGGIAAAAVGDYRSAGAVAVCLGSALWRRDLIDADDLEGLRRHATAVLATP